MEGPLGDEEVGNPAGEEVIGGETWWKNHG